MVIDKDLLTSARSGKKKAGRSELIKYLEGGKLTRMQAMKAKCYDCMGMGEGQDCGIPACTLYPFTLWGKQSARSAERALCEDLNANQEDVTDE